MDEIYCNSKLSQRYNTEGRSFSSLHACSNDPFYFVRCFKFFKDLNLSCLISLQHSLERLASEGFVWLLASLALLCLEQPQSHPVLHCHLPLGDLLLLVTSQGPLQILSINPCGLAILYHTWHVWFISESLLPPELWKPFVYIIIVCLSTQEFKLQQRAVFIVLHCIPSTQNGALCIIGTLIFVDWNKHVKVSNLLKIM